MPANRKIQRALIGIVSTLTALGPVLYSASPARAVDASSPTSAGNGYLIMIHASFGPDSQPMADRMTMGQTAVDQAEVGVLDAPGAVGATRDGGWVVFRAIPFSVATGRPVVVRSPRLQVDGLTGGRLVLEPNVDTANDSICRFETHWKGHEGPVDACTGYRVPADQFRMNAVSFTLRFVDSRGVAQEEVHNLPAHLLLHAALAGVPVDLRAVDRATTEPTPLLVEQLC